MGQKPVDPRVVQHLGAAVDADALEQAPEVNLHRVLADAELFGKESLHRFFITAGEPTEGDDVLFHAS